MHAALFPPSAAYDRCCIPPSPCIGDGYLKHQGIWATITLNPEPYSPLRDGYLKHQGNLGLKNPALVEKRRRVYADCVKQHLPGSKAEDGGKDGKAKSRK